METRKLLFVGGSGLLSLLGGTGYFFVLCQKLVSGAGDGRVFARPEDLPDNEVGLVLGTAKWTRRGTINRFFSYRMDAAARLYQSGKIRLLLLSGNGISADPGEPEAMRDELLARGVPLEALQLDSGGTRTLESIARAKQLFGLNRMTIVSQEFHNRRALFFCRSFGIEAVGFNAEDVPASEARWIFLRELLARVDAVLEMAFSAWKFPAVLRRSADTPASPS